jgi:hypothetical protein
MATATPTVTQAERDAATVKTILKEAAKSIPGLKERHAATARKLSGHRTVPKKFIRGMMAVVEAVDELRALGRFDVDKARAAFQFEAAFRPVADQLAFLLSSLTYTIDSGIASVAADALLAYTLAKGLARNERYRDLTTHLSSLKRDLGRKGPRKKKKATRRGSTTPNSA